MRRIDPWQQVHDLVDRQIARAGALAAEMAAAAMASVHTVDPDQDHAMKRRKEIAKIRTQFGQLKYRTIRMFEERRYG